MTTKYLQLLYRNLVGVLAATKNELGSCTAYTGSLCSLRRCTEASISSMWKKKGCTEGWEEQKYTLCAVFFKPY